MKRPAGVALCGATPAFSFVTNRGGDDMEPYEGVSARCALCDGEIYRGEKYYHINGQAVCRDCLAEYAVQVFAPYLVKGG